MSNLIDLLKDCRTCLCWLHIVEDDAYFKECIEVIKNRIDVYIDKELKDKYN